METPHKEKRITINQLAIMMQNGFTGMETRLREEIKEVKDGLTKVEDRLTNVETNLVKVETRLTDVEEELGAISRIPNNHENRISNLEDGMLIVKTKFGI